MTASDEHGSRAGNVVELDRPPSTARLFRRAALGALPGTGSRRGTELPDTTLVLREVEVDRAHLAAYDRVCGFRLADALPPTYPHVLAFPLAMQLMCGTDFPFPVVGLVHVANRIEVRRPVSASERLDLRVHAENLRPHERGRQLDVVASASVGDEEVWHGVSTYLRREIASDRRTEGDRPRPPAPTATWRVAPQVGTDYAAASGDHNPIHTSRLGARLLGFPRPIAHGMWSKARCLAALEGRLPDGYAAEVTFKLPILLPATVAFAATPAGRGWTVALHGARSGKPHLTGAVTA
jgi:acyl dehydratase